MRLQEAIDSGLPFKRACHTYWYKRVGPNISYDDDNASQISLKGADILADDWHVKVWSDDMCNFEAKFREVLLLTAGDLLGHTTAYFSEQQIKDMLEATRKRCTSQS